jgi:hypothetical protein
LPSVPQVDGACIWHMLRVSSPPAGIGVQVPSAWSCAHERQAPVHAWSQQTLSTQWLLTHSLAPAQGWPFVFLPQLPA